MRTKNSSPDDSKSKNAELLATAKTRFKLAETAESDSKKLALIDQKQRIGDQWDEKDKTLRAEDNRPCLTVNKMHQFIKQVCNDQRQNRPGIRVSPVDDKADVDTADVLQGLIRHIEYNSNAEIAYDTGFESAVEHGFGYWRVLTDYVSPDSFDQEILIKQVKDSMKVWCDPYFQEPDGSDMNWAFIAEDFNKDDYIAEYGESELAQMKDWASLSEDDSGWFDENSCRVVEYMFKEFEDKTLCLIEYADEESGELVQQTVYLDELPEGFPEEQIIQKRKTQTCTVRVVKINGHEILEETVWPGRYIPLIPMLGDDLIIEGKRYREGLIRQAIDSQKMLNYWVTCETEMIALSPKAPWIGVEGQFEGHEEEWETANTRPHAYLEYAQVSIAGKPAPPPQRNIQEAPVGAITNARIQASEDLKAVVGIYDDTLGKRAQADSGIAIQRRNQQSQTSNFHFVDNLARSIRHTGRIILDAIPQVYDTERAVRILAEDDEQKVVMINQIFEEGGKPKIYDLSLGKYDVTVDEGPNFQTKRQEAAESMLQFIQSYPQGAPLIADLIAKNLDWPGAQDIADRFKKQLPPELQNDGSEDDQVPPQVMAQMKQMDEMIQMLTEQLNKANEETRSKLIELESKERIEFSKQETDLLKEILKQSGLGAKIQVDAQLRELDMAQRQAGFREQYESQNLNGAASRRGAVNSPQNLNQQPAAEVYPASPNMEEY